MAEGKFVGYIRVSTAKQERSGLGLEAQRQTINNYLNGGSWELLSEYVEVESGKNNERPKLKQAIDHCRMTGAILVIAKLDRLSRDLHFIATLQKSNVKFVSCDMPEANEFTVHIMAAMAQQERKMISQRTKEALQAAKARGVKLGNPQNLSTEAANKGRKLGDVARIRKANQFASDVYPLIQSHQEQGSGLRQIARLFNEQGILSARGKTGSWTPTAIKNIVSRHNSRRGQNNTRG